MPTQLTADDARQSLTAHVRARGAEIFARYGPQLGWAQLQALLDDRSCVRYPCSIEFDSAVLKPGEFAFPEPRGPAPEDGFTIHVHPIYLTQLAMVPYLVLYHLVAVNYGEFAGHEDAEAFAAAALGLDQDLYYQVLCHLADQLASGLESDAAPPGGDCGCGS